MHSIRVRLIAVAALAVIVALAAVALFSRQAARTEFRSFVLGDHAQHLRGLAEAVAAQLTTEAGASRLDSLLQEMSRREGRDLVLLAPEGRVLAASRPALRAARVTTSSRGLEIEQEERGPRLVARMKTILQGAPDAVVRAPGGAVVGRLVLMPPGRDSAERVAAFGARFDARLLLAALVAGAVAIGLAWWLSHRILRPVEALTRAARRLGTGDLGSRVPAGGSDELGELSRAFNAMAEDLARQESLRRTMVSDVAHELRSPVTNLRCQIEAIEDGLLPASPETVRSLREEVLLLSRLVEDLQPLSVADAGRLVLDRAAASVADLVDGALESFRAAAAERRIALRSEVGVLPPVEVDATRIAQVLRNLLTNALTHTSPGGTITVSATAEGPFVAVTVRDDGPGITPEHLPHVFERFYRADPSRARATGGAGLGLAIVQGIVRAHGGAVTAASQSGAVFRFTLPVAG